MHTVRPWFWQRSLQNRIVLTYGLLFLVILLLLLAYTGEEIYRVQVEQAEHDLEVSAFLIANALEDPLSEADHVLASSGIFDLEEQRIVRDVEADEEHNDDQEAERAAELVHLQTLVNLNVRDEIAYITLLGVDGTVIVDSRHTPQPQPQPLTQVEIQAAFQGVEQHDVRPDAVSGLLTLYAAAPIQESDKLLGIIQLARPMQSALRPTRIFLAKLAIGGLFALSLTILIGLLLGRYLVRPLRELEKTALAITQGDLNQTAPEGNFDEVGALAASFNHMVARLRELLDQQRQFVANASHELRTPLTNIKLRSEALLMTDAPLPERAKRYLTEIDSEADRLRRLANTLLNLASLERQSYQPPQTAVNIAPLLWEVVRSFRITAQHARQTLVVQIPETLPPLFVWPDHIVSIMNNLLDNAIKYTPAGGEIRLLVTVTAECCRLQLQNSGDGILPADLPYIFERFYRVDKARSRQAAQRSVSSGAGLGLAIVKSLIELNRGAITVESKEGVGVRFTLQFPLIDGHPM